MSRELTSAREAQTRRPIARYHSPFNRPPSMLSDMPVMYLARSEHRNTARVAGAGVWELPGLGSSKPGIGTRYQPQ
jgi:hypothetical protein